MKKGNTRNDGLEEAAVYLEGVARGAEEIARGCEELSLPPDPLGPTLEIRANAFWLRSAAGYIRLLKDQSK